MHQSTDSREYVGTVVKDICYNATPKAPPTRKYGEVTHS
jgi:hypothetical protein